MELWIRSQDKKDLIKATSICMTKEDYDNIGIFVNGCLVGLYKSTQRALEVLDEIQQVILYIGLPDKELIQHFKEKCVIGNFSANSKSCIAIYEMPEENNHE